MTAAVAGSILKTSVPSPSEPTQIEPPTNASPAGSFGSLIVAVTRFDDGVDARDGPVRMARHPDRACGDQDVVRLVADPDATHAERAGIEADDLVGAVADRPDRAASDRQGAHRAAHADVRVTLFRAGSMRATVPAPSFATHTAPYPEPTPHGPRPVTIVATTRGDAAAAAAAATAATIAMTKPARTQPVIRREPGGVCLGCPLGPGLGQEQRERRAGGRCAAGVPLDLAGDRRRVDDRVAPLVEP